LPHIIGAAKRFHGRCKIQKNFIPLLMALGVIDIFKMVNIHHN